LERWNRLDDAIIERLSENPAEPALWWNDEWWSGERLKNEVLKCQETLSGAGIAPGSRIAVFAPNSPLLWITAIAAWRLGATVSPLNGRGGPEIILNIVRRIDPSLVVLGKGMESVAGILENQDFPIVVSSLDGDLPMVRARVSEPSEKEIAVLFATSGTTGEPKGVPVTHLNLLDNSRRVHETIEGFETGRVIMNVLPNFHSFGFTVCGVLPLRFGLPMVLLPSFIPLGNTVETLRKTSVSIMIAVPTMLPFLLGAVTRGEVKLPDLDYILTGGGKLDGSLEKRIREEMGVICFEGYGLTECSPVVSCNPSEKTRKLGTVGPPLPGYDVKVMDIDGETQLPLSEEGVLWLRGPSVVSGYFRAPALTDERFSHGWFNTGDIVRIDEDGYISILDRATDLVIVGGFNVYPQEVETVLNSHPSVSMAAAVGMPSSISGEVVRAFVVVEEGAVVSRNELIQFAKERLAHFKVPRKIDFVDALPMSGAGKVLRRELKSNR